MSFQAYLDNIQEKTGKTPEDFIKLAKKKAFSDSAGLRDGVKVSDVVAWLKADFELGHGHAMAIVALIKGTKNVGDK